MSGAGEDAHDFRVSSPRRGSLVSSECCDEQMTFSFYMVCGSREMISQSKYIKILILTIDGRNPAPPGMYKTL